MTDYLDKLRQLPNPAQLAISKGKGISVSRANVWHECQQRAWFKYVAKYPDPPGEAMLHGSAFDALTEGKTPDFSGITPENQAVIESRAEEYMDMIDNILYRTRQTQVPLYAPLDDGYWFFGWADDLFTDADGNLFLEDRKFSSKPWPWKKELIAILDDNDEIIAWKGESDKVKYYHKQAQCYIWALRQMGRDVREMTFKVANLREPGIQWFTYRPQAKSLSTIADWLMEAARMPSQVIQPHGGRHCEWCPYKVQCDEVLWGRKVDPSREIPIWT